MNSHERKSKWLRGLSIGTGFALLALASWLLIEGLTPKSLPGAFIGWSVAGLIVLGAGQIFLRLAMPDPQYPPADRSATDIRPAVDEALRDAVALIAELGNDEALAVTAYWEMLLDPKKTTLRISEKVHLTRTWTTRDTELIHRTPKSLLEVSVPDRLSNYFVPALLPLKGTLLHDFKIIRSPEDYGVSLPQRRARALLVAGCLSLYRQAFSVSGSVSSWPNQNRVHLSALLSLILRHRKGLEQDLDGAIAQTERNVNSLLSAMQSTDQDAKQSLSKLIQLGYSRYIVAFETTPSPMPFTISFSYRQRTRVITKPLENADTFAAFKSRLGLALPPPGYYHLSLTRATEADSYHLHTVTAPGSYIGLAPVENANGIPATLNRPRYARAGLPYFRPMDLGGSEGHFYSRGQEERHEASTLSLRIFERPYGCDLLGLVSGLIAVIAIALLASGARSGKFGSDLVAVVLAAPTLLGALVALFLKTIKNCVQFSMAGLVCGVLSVTTAVGALFQYFIAAASGSGSFRGWPWTWALTLVVSVLVLLVSAVMFGVRLFRFLRIRE